MSQVESKNGVYDGLMAAKSDEDDFDRHVLASILASSQGQPLLSTLGFDRAALSLLLGRYFPNALAVDDLIGPDADPGQDAIEESDYRRLLLDGRAKGDEIEEWLAFIVARRSMTPEHLWRSLGLRNRNELSQLLHRHFPALVARNVRNMRWKKFFYREMCQTEGVYVCKSPVCDDCASYDECFRLED